MKTKNIIDIRDPNLKQEEILEHIATRTAGKESPDFAAIGPESLRQPVTTLTSDNRSLFDSNESFVELMVSHQLQEPDFTSQIPGLGHLIVNFRRLWNWMSTKWYVRPIIEQQSMVNGQIAILLLEMEAWMDEKEKTIAKLEEKVSQLESIILAEEPDKK